jgi:hypothetical protein
MIFLKVEEMKWKLVEDQRKEDQMAEGQIVIEMIEDQIVDDVQKSENQVVFEMNEGCRV